MFAIWSYIILQNDNGQEFTAIVVEKMTILSKCKVIHGRPRYPQTQKSVEHCNQDVENMLKTWMIDSQSTD